LLAALFVIGPMSLGIIDAHKFRDAIGAAPDATYETVRFPASDGVDLAGWYRPTRNGSTVLLVHGGGSDREGMVAHARMLAGHGYGVLLYDARGAGESDGNQNSYGWGWAEDVGGALDYLATRPEVDPARIGAFGSSTGADALLEVAAERRDLAAVVTDGAAAGSFEDWHRLRGTEIGLPPGWLMFKTIEVATGSSPGPALEDQVARITSPLLLISAGMTDEREFNVLYDEAAPSAEHWNLPDASHTAAIRQHAAEYEERVVGFFDDALGLSAAAATSGGGGTG
jgi:pimeloyl-ACP methyl ester carboxylesterase